MLISLEVSDDICSHSRLTRLVSIAALLRRYSPTNYGNHFNVTEQVDIASRQLIKIKRLSSNNFDYTTDQKISHGLFKLKGL